VQRLTTLASYHVGVVHLHDHAAHARLGFITLRAPLMAFEGTILLAMPSFLAFSIAPRIAAVVRLRSFVGIILGVRPENGLSDCTCRSDEDPYATEDIGYREKLADRRLRSKVPVADGGDRHYREVSGIKK
jgi:hypothetical protein